MPYPIAERHHIQKVFDISSEIDIPTKDLFDEALKKYNIYFIIPALTSYYEDPQIKREWSKYIGERILYLDKPDAICELIASTIALNEGLIDMINLSSELEAVGTNKKAIAAVSKALSQTDLNKIVKRAKTSQQLPKIDSEDSIKTL